MPAKSRWNRPAVLLVVVAVGGAFALLVAVVFDAPTSVCVLLAIAVGASLASSADGMRAGR